eukprot:gene9899-10754_t
MEKLGNHRGNFNIKEWMLFQTSYQTITSATQPSHNEIVIIGEVFGSFLRASYSLRFFIPEQVSNTNSKTSASYLTKQIAFDLHVRAKRGQFNRIFLNYWCDIQERFYGFGVQYSVWNVKGRRIPIVVSEQGIGRGTEPITTFLNLFADGAGGDWSTTYAPKPYYLTNLNRSLMLENPEISFFDLREDDSVAVEVWSDRVRGRILYGNGMLDIISELTEYTGRMQPLPDWTQEGAIIGLQGGSAKVKEKIDLILNNDMEIKVGGIWLQDWVGLRHSFDGDRLRWNWKLDKDYYPDWQSMITELRNRNIRTLVYVSPFLSDPAKITRSNRSTFLHAVQNNYFVKNRHGAIYKMISGSIEFCMIDLTNPLARQWIKDIIKSELIINAGASGWMADFGEYLPFDALLFDGRSGAQYHNLYPEEWGRINAEAVAEAEHEMNLNREIMFFSRSGWMRAPAHISLFWLGDQMVSWDGCDGLQSTILASLTSGLSGHSLVHSDIGGQTSHITPFYRLVRSEELLLRWIEISAFGSAVFRTHVGLSISPLNAQIYSSQRILNHFAHFSQIFHALKPYRQQLMREAAEKGWPLIRSMAAHYAYDEKTWDVAYQYLFGSELIVAPIIETASSFKEKVSLAARNNGDFSDYGVAGVRIYVPAKSAWVHTWTGEQVEGGEKGREMFVESPLKFPAVFYRKGSKLNSVFQNMGIRLLHCPEEENPKRACISKIINIP